METFLEMPHAGSWPAVRWAEAAQLAVPWWALRSRPRAVYAVALQLLNGTRLPLEDGSIPAEGGTNAEQYATPLLHRSVQLHHRGWSVHEWAHVFERLWLAVFDVDYTPAGPPADTPHAHASAAAAKAPATQVQPPAMPALLAAAAARAAADAAEGLLFDLRLPGQADADVAAKQVSAGGDDKQNGYGSAYGGVFGEEAADLASGDGHKTLPDAAAFLAAAQAAR